MSMVRGEFVGHRPCPARSAYVELVIRIEQKRLNWCVPGGESDTVAGPAPERLELRWHRGGVHLVGVRPADEVPVTGAAAVGLLADGQVELLVDDRLIALHQ
jgi:hypothetical protein